MLVRELFLGSLHNEIVWGCLLLSIYLSTVVTSDDLDFLRNKLIQISFLIDVPHMLLIHHEIGSGKIIPLPLPPTNT